MCIRDSGGRGREGRSGPGKRRAPRGARHRVGKTDDGRGRTFGKGRGRETLRRPGASQAPENGERERWRRGPRATARGFREASEGTREAEVGRPGAHAGSHRPRPPAQGRSRGTRGRRPGPPRRAPSNLAGLGGPNRHRSRDRFSRERSPAHAQRRPAPTPPARLPPPLPRRTESTSPGDAPPEPRRPRGGARHPTAARPVSVHGGRS